MRVIASGCNIIVEKVSILGEKILYPLADRVNSKVKDNKNKLEIIHYI